MLDLKQCLPTPTNQLPPFLQLFVSFGEEAKKAFEQELRVTPEVIAEINFRVQRLWTYSVLTNKPFSMFIKTPEAFLFIAFRVENGEEQHSIIPVPSMLAWTIEPALREKHDAVGDDQLNAILCHQNDGEMN